jgi:hypothetical protein
MVREAGFEAVINLALPTSDNALANEGSVVTGLMSISRWISRLPLHRISELSVE